VQRLVAPVGEPARHLEVVDLAAGGQVGPALGDDRGGDPLEFAGAVRRPAVDGQLERVRPIRLVGPGVVDRVGRQHRPLAVAALGGAAAAVLEGVDRRAAGRQLRAVGADQPGVDPAAAEGDEQLPAGRLAGGDELQRPRRRFRPVAVELPPLEERPRLEHPRPAGAGHDAAAVAAVAAGVPRQIRVAVGPQPADEPRQRPPRRRVDRREARGAVGYRQPVGRVDPDPRPGADVAVAGVDAAVRQQHRPVGAAAVAPLPGVGRVPGPGVQQLPREADVEGPLGDVRAVCVVGDRQPCRVVADLRQLHGRRRRLAGRRQQPVAAGSRHLERVRLDTVGVGARSGPLARQCHLLAGTRHHRFDGQNRPRRRPAALAVRARRPGDRRPGDAGAGRLQYVAPVEQRPVLVRHAWSVV
jgi:hypothetical protein